MTFTAVRSYYTAESLPGQEYRLLLTASVYFLTAPRTLPSELCHFTSVTNQESAAQACPEASLVLTGQPGRAFSH